jgi:hypothetical protein
VDVRERCLPLRTYGTVCVGFASRLMFTDRHDIQTRVPYATEDPETMSEAHGYQAHIFTLFRRYIGSRVLESGCGIGTTTRRPLEVCEYVLEAALFEALVAAWAPWALPLERLLPVPIGLSLVAVGRPQNRTA